MLLILPFSNIVHHLQVKQALVLSHNESRKITVTDRQKNGQTDIRTNRRTRALGQKRGKTDKTEAETRSRRQQNL